jgi:hypothetical protein
MRRLAFLWALLAALALPSLALAGGPPAGKYTTKILTPPPLKGTWAISFARGGRYTIRQNGAVVVRGTYLSVAPQIEFSKESGSKCVGRAYVLGHRFTLAG